MESLKPDFARYSLEERVSLIKTALGLTPADIIVTSVNLVEVNTGSILEDTAILLKGRRIAGILKTREIGRFRGDNTLVLDGRNQYVMPGFIDSHIHIESSMLDPIGFSKIVLKHGTTTVVADPHEIVNVLGIRGFELFVEASKYAPLKILLEIPSCIPPTNPSMGLETPPNTLTTEDLDSMINTGNVVGLGEVMDFLSVLNADEKLLEKIKYSIENNLVVDGHAPLLLPEELNAYISAGILSDHESTNINEAYEKAWRGMYLYIREGSAWRDLEALVKILRGSDCKLCAFTSDDVNVVDLIEKGAMDRIVNKAIQLGLDPVKAIQLATINPAMRLHLEDHIGLIAPGRLGDIVFSSRIEYIQPTTILANGEIVYYNGKLVREFKRPQYPDYALNTVRISDELIDKIDIGAVVAGSRGVVRVNVIRVEPGSALTKHIVEELRVVDGRIQPSPERDTMHVGVVYRHSSSGGYSTGFIQNLGFKYGAVAQTIAHDTHNIIYAGWSINDIKRAIKRIKEIQGGIVIVDNGEVVVELPLRLAGLMSIEEPEVVYEKYKSIVKKLEERDAVFEYIFMTLSLVSLPVIPEIRITDRGLIDVRKGRIIPLIAE